MLRNHGGICYAGCYARLFYVNKKRRKCYTETRYNASYKPGDKARNKESGCSAVGSALPTLNIVKNDDFYLNYVISAE